MRKLGAWILLSSAALTLISRPSQAQIVEYCVVSFPFEPTAANRVPARDLHRLFAGRSAVFFRRPSAAAQPAPGGDQRNAPPPLTAILFTVEWRADGSGFFRCEIQRRGSNSYEPCRLEGRDQSSSTSTWRIADGNYCWTSVNLRGETETCHSIHRQEGRYVAKRVSAGSCLEGEIVFK